MANSLRNKIKHFCYKGYLSERERDRLLNALDDADRINSELKQQPCEDCIRREDAINAAIEAADEWDGGCNLERANMINKALEELSSVTPKAKWIPVSERLPEANGRYVVTRGLNACGALWNRVYIVNYSDLMGLKSERIWWDGNVGKSDFKRIDDVIAWMPLSEPYKGESEE